MRTGTWVILAAALAALATGASAQDAPVPERRAVYEAGVDLYGGDLRSIFDTDLASCHRSCLADPACRAFTYNTAAGACFLKDAPERSEPYPAALSARIVETPPQTLALAARRAARLGFLRDADFKAARRRAERLGASLALAGSLDGPAARLLPAAEAVSETDAAEDWMALARGALVLRREGRLPRALAGLDADAALNAALRAGPPQFAVGALGLLAASLEDAGRGRASLSALKLAQEIAPSTAGAAALDRARGLFGFRVVEHEVEADTAAPRLCLTFSEPLVAAGVDYADYVRLDRAAAPAEADGRKLCIEGLAHGARYAVTLREGLPSAEREALAKPVELSIYVRDRAPSARFTGRAYVLPKGAGARIPVVTVNTSEVALELFRVGERGLAAAIEDGLFGSNLSEWTRDRLADRLGSAIWSGMGEVEAPLNEEVTTLLPLQEALEGSAPGVYALRARVPGDADDWGQAPTQWFVITDLGVSTASGAGGFEVSVRGLSDALPRIGARARLIAASNEVLGEVVTGADGRVRFDAGLMRGRGGMAPALLTVDDGEGDFAFLDLDAPAFDLSDRGVEGRPAPPPVDVFLSTERGAYRPGETVFATVLARDGRAQAVEGLTLTAIIARPDGVEHARLALPDRGAGGRALRLALDRSAMRGRWRLAIHADPGAPALATASFLVEEFEPERVDAELTLPEGALDPAALPPVEVAARYLWGAPAAGLTIEGEARVAPVRALPGREGWLFGLADDPARPDLAVLNEGIVTGPDGRATVALPLPQIAASSRPMTLTATLRFSDGSGRPVERAITRPLLPSGPLIGLRPLFDGAAEEGANAEVEVIALGRDLSAIPMRAAWTLTRVETDYQWYRIGGRWNWEPVVSRSRIASGEVEIGVGGPATISAPVDWGRYELRLASLDGPPAAASIAFSAGWNAAPGAAETPDLLAAGLDRARYAVGDEARLRVDAPHAGRLVVQALTDRVVAMRELDVAAGETEIALPVTEEWGAGAYVSATLIRPMETEAGRGPARAIGLAWAGVDPGRRQLSARFLTPAEARPRGPLDATLKIDGAAPGETVWATIAAVDEGILNLTGFEAPDPAGHYFGQRRLGVELRDLYGRLIDGLTGTQGRVRSGGDSALGRNDAPTPTQELVAFFSGPLRAGPDGLVTARFDLPAFNGSVKLMAIVWSAAGVGRAQADVLVRDPVVAAASGPRFLAPGDESRLLVELTHVRGPAGAATVTASASGGIALTDVTERRVTLESGGRASVELPLRAVSAGAAELALSVVTPGGETLTSVYRLPVRANDPEIARRSRPVLAPGARLVLDENAYAGLVPGTGRASLAAGPAASLDVAGLVAALDRYPYGCTEQVTSRAMPLLYLSDAAAAMGLAPPDETRERVRDAVRRVLANQSAAGSFGLWRPDGGDLWLDAYVTDFLSRARAEGIAPPEMALASALDNLANRLNYAGDFEEGGEDIAYALFVLAREGRAMIGDLRYHADAKAEAFSTPLARAQLGAALAFMGDQRRADAMFRSALGLLTARDGFGWRPDFGSGFRDAAGVLALAAEARSEAVDIKALTARLSSDPRPASMRSTQENAWTLLAARALAGAAADAGLTVNGVAAEGAVIRLAAAGDAAVVVENRGAAPVDAVLTVTGVPETPEPAGGAGYRIERQWMTLDGEIAEAGVVERGRRLVALLTVTPERQAAGRLIVSDPLPAGFEIDNPNLIVGGQAGRLGWLDLAEVASHSEFRTDRFVAAVDWGGTAPFRLAYIVRAVSPGRFRHPAASVEDMYRPAFRARTDTGSVVVLP